MNISKQRERDLRSFSNGLIAIGVARGVQKAEIKREGFPSYATGNRRIEHKPGEITVNDILNIAVLYRMTPAELLSQAAANMANMK